MYWHNVALLFPGGGTGLQRPPHYCSKFYFFTPLRYLPWWGIFIYYYLCVRSLPWTLKVTISLRDILETSYLRGETLEVKILLIASLFILR
jgi:hypothetical protein